MELALAARRQARPAALALLGGRGRLCSRPCLLRLSGGLGLGLSTALCSRLGLGLRLRLSARLGLLSGRLLLLAPLIELTLALLLDLALNHAAVLCGLLDALLPRRRARWRRYRPARLGNRRRCRGLRRGPSGGSAPLSRRLGRRRRLVGRSGLSPCRGLVGRRGLSPCHGLGRPSGRQCR